MLIVFRKRIVFLLFIVCVLLLIAVMQVRFSKIRGFRSLSPPKMIDVSEFGSKPWFLSGGTYSPPKSKWKNLFVNKDTGNRIIEQLMYVPEEYQEEKSPVKVILGYNLQPRRCPVPTDERRAESPADQQYCRGYGGCDGGCRRASAAAFLQC